MPVPSDVTIRIDGIDRTDVVLYAGTRFSASANAGIGTFSMTLKDVARNQSYTNGDIVELELDDKRYFGGFLMQTNRNFAFPVVDTTVLANVTSRQFPLRGTNYNVLFDRLVAHNPANHLVRLPLRPAGSLAGNLVKELWDDYIDLPAGFDVTTFVDDVGVADPQGEFAWVNGGEQGVQARREMEWVSQKNAAIWYFDADKKLHFHSPESVFARWGFSDRPNNASVSSLSTGFAGALYGFREMDTVEDISGMVNDIFVWGGSEWQDTGGTVFARSTNSTSITAHGRWQDAVVAFGELGIQEQVDAVANAIVQGPGDPYVTPGTSGGLTRNKSVPAWTVKLAWFAHDVPTMQNGVKDHLTPGDIVTIVLWVHGSGPTKPLILTLPLRQVDITFPTLPTDGGQKTFVRFEGTFGLSVDDPHDLWRTILRRRDRIVRQVQATASPTTTTPFPGAVWQGAPVESPNGSRTVFTFITGSGAARYVSGTSEVYVNGLRLRQGADYSEQPTAGSITLFAAPSIGSTIWAYVRLLA